MMYKTFISMFVLNLLLPNSALAQEVFFPLQAKEDFAEKGIVTGIVYTVDYFANTQGGTKRGDAFLTNLDLTLDIDTKMAGLWDGGQIFVYLLANSGSDKLTGSLVGDLQTVSNIEAPRTMRLYELWYQHHFLEDKFSVLFGFHDYNSEFDVTEYGGLYINSSFGIQPDISAGARPSIFPLAAPGIRLKVTPHQRWELLFGVYDGDSGDPDESEHFPRSVFDSEGGAFIAGEVAYHFNSDHLAGFIKIGIWNNTGEFDDVIDLDDSGSSIKRKNNIGGYVLIDKQLYKETDDQGLGAFFQFGTNDKRMNEVNWYVGGGVNYRGLIPGRGQDEIGLAVAHAFINEDIVDAGGRKDYETAFELTYSAQINDVLRVQPDIQYIINPGAVIGIQDALVIGLRAELGF